MKSIKTTIGGAVGTLGTSLQGYGVISAMSQFNGTGNIDRVTFYLVTAGFILSCVGKSLTALFAADNSSVTKCLAEHSEQIEQLKGDTTQLLKDQADTK